MHGSSEPLRLVENFYNGMPVELPATRMCADGVPRTYDKPLQLPEKFHELDNSAVREKLREINSTWGFFESDGYRFEKATVNTNDAGRTDRPYKVFFSTANSSISTNAGNAYEFALRAAVHPEQPAIYIASIGNGYSSFVRGDDAEYYKRTGRMTKESHDGVAEGIDIVKALANALEDNNIQVSKVCGDSLGTAEASALATELGKRNLPVSNAFFNSRTQVTDKDWYKLLLLPVLVNVLDKRNYDARVNTYDPFSVINQPNGDIRKLLPRAYNPQSLKDIRSSKSHDPSLVGRLLTNLWAVSRGPNSGDPLYKDTQALVRNNPDIKATFLVGGEDHIYTQERSTAIRDLLGKLSIQGSGYVEFLQPRVWHVFNKPCPFLRDTIEHDALSA